MPIRFGKTLGNSNALFCAREELIRFLVVEFRCMSLSVIAYQCVLYSVRVVCLRICFCYRRCWDRLILQNDSWRDIESVYLFFICMYFLCTSLADSKNKHFLLRNIIYISNEYDCDNIHHKNHFITVKFQPFSLEHPRQINTRERSERENRH